MVILVAVSINTIYNMSIVQKAQSGVQTYAQKSVEENEMMDKTVGLIEDAVGKINDILDENREITITIEGQPYTVFFNETWREFVDRTGYKKIGTELTDSVKVSWWSGGSDTTYVLVADNTDVLWTELVKNHTTYTFRFF